MGAGLKKLEDSARPMSSVLPKGVEWVKDKAIRFQPKSQKVVCSSGKEVEYDYLVVALGIQLHYDHVLLLSLPACNFFVAILQYICVIY